MGLVKTEITLRNAGDMIMAKEGLIDKQDIRELTAEALVDTGAWTIAINEEVRETLGLETVGTRYGTLADGSQSSYNLAGPLDVTWKDRRMVCDAMVLPGAKHILLGAIPMEAMDLIVCPNKEEVVGAHGDEIVHIVC